MEKIATYPTFNEAMTYVDGYRAAETGPKVVFHITTTEGDGFTWYQVWIVTGAIWTP